MALKKTLTSQNQNNPRPLALMDNITINKNSNEFERLYVEWDTLTNANQDRFP